MMLENRVYRGTFGVESQSQLIIFILLYNPYLAVACLPTVPYGRRRPHYPRCCLSPPPTRGISKTMVTKDRGIIESTLLMSMPLVVRDPVDWVRVPGRRGKFAY